MIRKILDWYGGYLVRKEQKEIEALIDKLYASYYKAKDKKKE